MTDIITYNWYVIPLLTYCFGLFLCYPVQYLYRTCIQPTFLAPTARDYRMPNGHYARSFTRGTAVVVKMHPSAKVSEQVNIPYTRKHELHWLDIPERIQFRTAVTVHRCLNGLAPAYLTELCIPITQSRSSCRLRSS